MIRIRITRSQFSSTNTQQLLIVRQLTQETHRKRLAILEVPIELLLQIVVDILHGIAAVAVNHVVIRRSELRATLQQHHPFSLGMREVHGEGLIQNEKRETGLSEVLHIFHLVVSIVHKPIIKQRQVWRKTHHEIGFHEVRHETTNA